LIKPKPGSEWPNMCALFTYCKEYMHQISCMLVLLILETLPKPQTNGARKRKPKWLVGQAWLWCSCRMP
jgi:hypothetical protein